MPIDTELAIDRCRTLLPDLDPQMRLYLEVALQEAAYMQLVREVVAGNVVVDGDDSDD